VSPVIAMKTSTRAILAKNARPVIPRSPGQSKSLITTKTPNSSYVESTKRWIAPPATKHIYIRLSLRLIAIPAIKSMMCIKARKARSVRNAMTKMAGARV
jgi:hypothetical protein